MANRSPVLPRLEEMRRPTLRPYPYMLDREKSPRVGAVVYIAALLAIAGCKPGSPTNNAYFAARAAAHHASHSDNGREPGLGAGAGAALGFRFPWIGFEFNWTSTFHGDTVVEGDDQDTSSHLGVFGVDLTLHRNRGKTEPYLFSGVAAAYVPGGDAGIGLTLGLGLDRWMRKTSLGVRVIYRYIAFPEPGEIGLSGARVHIVGLEFEIARRYLVTGAPPRYIWVQQP